MGMRALGRTGLQDEHVVPDQGGGKSGPITWEMAPLDSDSPEVTGVLSVAH
jgi:hypothetical protein